MAQNLASVHGALLLTQFCWGSAAVVNKLGLSGAGISPLLFALIREASAAPVLLALLYFSTRASRRQHGSERVAVELDPKAEDGISPRTSIRSWRRSALQILPGFFIFVDQLCSLTGDALAGPVSAAAWQPSQVIFTLLICSCLGMESITMRKAASMLLTVMGALCIVFLGGSAQSGDSDKRHNHFIGQIFFVCNCLASSLEIILWRMLLCDDKSEHAHFAVMARSYLVAACFMALAFFSTSFSPRTVDFFCPACEGNPYHLPSNALFAVAYSVVFQTIVAYCAQAWALRFAHASMAALYATAQPIMAALVTCFFLIIGFNPGSALMWPGLEMIGALFIIAGLVLSETGPRLPPRQMTQLRSS